MKVNIRRTLPEYKNSDGKFLLMKDFYKFHDGTWIKHWWFGPIWLTVSSL
jgi:hypothetical protein